MKNAQVLYFENEESCEKHLQELRWDGIVKSPFRENSKVYYCSKGKYKCRDSKKYFTVRTNTLFHNSRVPLTKWFSAIIISTESKITSVELATSIGVTQKTAWFMLQKINKHEARFKSSNTDDAKVSNKLHVLDERLNVIQWLNLIQ